MHPVRNVDAGLTQLMQIITNAKCGLKSYFKAPKRIHESIDVKKICSKSRNLLTKNKYLLNRIYSFANFDK